MTILSEKYLPTTDDWHPNYSRDTVLCQLHGDGVAQRVGRHTPKAIKDAFDKATATGQYPSYRITVWGNDDTGMEKHFLSRTEAERMHRALPNPLTMEWLREKGFINA